MALGDTYKIHSLSLDIDQLGSIIYVGALTAGSLPPDGNIVREQTGTSLYPTSGRLDLKSVSFNFTTLDVAKVLANFGITGLCATTTNPKIGISIYAAKWGCSGVAAGSVHRRYIAKSGALYINSLSCDHQGDAQITGTVRAVYDGTNQPITIEDNVALPTAVNLADTGRWTLGNATVNSVALLSKKSLSIDWGTSVSTEGVDSEPYDRIVLVDSVQPTISWVGIDPKWLSDLGVTITGLTVADTNTNLYLKKRNTLIATAEHIRIQANGLAHWRNLFDANGRNIGQTSLDIATTTGTGGNAPLVINTAIAHP
jgi:hypothetical protein